MIRKCIVDYDILQHIQISKTLIKKKKKFIADQQSYR